MKYKHLIFDFDGTLVDTLPDVAVSLSYAFSSCFKCDINFSKQQVSLWVGRGLPYLIRCALKSLHYNFGYSSEISMFFLDYYRSNPVQYSRLYPYVLPTLNHLRTVAETVSICSNKPEKTLVNVIKAFKLAHLFDHVSGGDTFNIKKPNPDHLLRTCPFISDLNLSQCLFVGDSNVDIETARAANIDSVLVTYGYMNKSLSNLNPDYRIDCFSEILELCDA